MANSEEKVYQFLEAIKRYAEEQSHDIRQGVEDFKREKLAIAERQVLTESAALMQREQTAIEEEMRCELSRRDADARRRLLEKRSSIKEEVFALVRQKLVAYTATPAYANSLKESLAKLCDLLPADGTVYLLRRADEALLPTLTPLVPTNSTLTLADDITLGGIRGENLAAGIAVDDSLDTRLLEQTAWFEQHSGLTVTL